MAEALATSSSSNNNRTREMENLSLEISKYPRDLLQKFFPPNQNQPTRLGDVDEDDDGLNLGLGLSLGGKFGIDKSHKLGLIRSSSIAGTMPLIGEIDRVAPPPPTPVHTLSRTASLPVETEEEWRKRKEMQTLRRMEAKRRRSEKQRVLKEGGGGGGEEKGVESLNFRGRLKREQQCLGMANKPFGSSTPPKVEVKARRTTFGSLQGFLMAQSQAQAQAQAPAQAQGQGQGSQGSGESQGGNSSGVSELESKTHQGSSSCGEARSPASSHSQQDRVSQDSGTKGGESTHHLGLGLDSESSSLKQPENHGDHNKKQEGGMEDMPCVFTIGSGPNGIRKVEGILYRFGKGEEVRIMCVCHGSFFSPADFVKHAGGKDVDHPLRHIVVSPSAAPFP